MIRATCHTHLWHILLDQLWIPRIQKISRDYQMAILEVTSCDVKMRLQKHRIQLRRYYPIYLISEMPMQMIQRSKLNFISMCPLTRLLSSLLEAELYREQEEFHVNLIAPKSILRMTKLSSLRTLLQVRSFPVGQGQGRVQELDRVPRSEER